MPVTGQTISTLMERAAAHASQRWAIDKGIIDNTYAANPFLREAVKRWEKREMGGGQSYVYGIRLSKMGGEASYQGFDELPTTQVSTDTVAQIDTKEYARQVPFSFRDRDLIHGPRAFSTEARIRLQQALQQIADDLNIHMQSDDGTGNNSKRVRGMKLWIASDPTDSSVTPGGVSQSSNSNWQNQTKNNSNTRANLLLDLRDLVTDCKSGNRGPTYGICNRAFRNCLEGLFSGTYYHNPVPGEAKPLVGKSGDPAIGTLYYRGIPITEDESYTQYGTSTGPGECLFIDESTMFILNALMSDNRLENLYEYVTPQRANKQTAEVGFVRAHLEVGCWERRRNGIIFNVGADA